MTLSMARISRAHGPRAKGRLHRLTSFALLTTAISSLSGEAVRAGQYGSTWTGAINNDWFLAGNWSNLETPGSVVEVRISNKTGAVINGAAASADMLWIGVGPAGGGATADLTLRSSLQTRTASVGYADGMGTLMLSSGAIWGNTATL